MRKLKDGIVKPDAVRPSCSELRVLGHAGAVVLRAAVSHTSYALVPRLGVDIPFTHSPTSGRPDVVSDTLSI